MEKITHKAHEMWRELPAVPQTRTKPCGQHGVLPQQQAMSQLMDDGVSHHWHHIHAQGGMQYNTSSGLKPASGVSRASRYSAVEGCDDTLPRVTGWLAYRNCRHAIHVLHTPLRIN